MKRIILIAAILITCLQHGFSQWIQTDGPYGAINPVKLVAGDSLLFATTSCGYFTKSHLADNWEFRAGLYIKDVIMHNDSIFMAQMYNGTRLINNATGLDGSTAFHAFPADVIEWGDSCIFGGNKTQGFSKINLDGIQSMSYNNGLPTDTLWNPWNGTYYETDVRCILATPSYIYCGTKKGIYRSAPFNITWTPVNTGLPLLPVTIAEAYNDTLYIVIDSSIYISSDQGNNWNSFYNSPSRVTSILKHANTFYAGTAADGVLKTDNNGVSWTSLNTGLNNLSINSIVYFDSTIVSFIWNEGAYYLQSNLQWMNDKKGMICSDVRSLNKTTSELIATDFYNIYKKSTADDWTDITPAVVFELFGESQSSGDTLILSIEYDNPGDAPYIIYSTDQGSTYSAQVQVPQTGDDPYTIYYKDGRLYAYEDDFMYYTDNFGLSWTDISMPAQFCNNFDDFMVHNNTPFAAACAYAELIQLNGTTWTLTNNGLPQNYLDYMCGCDSILLAGIDNSGLYSSNDNGATWTYAGVGPIYNRMFYDIICHDHRIFATTDSGVFMSNNYGFDWRRINEGLKNVSCGPITIYNDTLYMSVVGNFLNTRGNGIWKRSLNEVLLSIDENPRNNNSLFIYPNPAGTYCYIYSDKNEEAKIEISDLSGRALIQTLITGDKKIDISTLNEGVYIVRTIGKYQQASGKLVIRK